MAVATRWRAAASKREVNLLMALLLPGTCGAAATGVSAAKGTAGESAASATSASAAEHAGEECGDDHEGEHDHLADAGEAPADGAGDSGCAAWGGVSAGSLRARGVGGEVGNGYAPAHLVERIHPGKNAAGEVAALELGDDLPVKVAPPVRAKLDAGLAVAAGYEEQYAPVPGLPVEIFVADAPLVEENGGEGFDAEIGKAIVGHARYGDHHDRYGGVGEQEIGLGFDCLFGGGVEKFARVEDEVPVAGAGERDDLRRRHLTQQNGQGDKRQQDACTGQGIFTGGGATVTPSQSALPR